MKIIKLIVLSLLIFLYYSSFYSDINAQSCFNWCADPYWWKDGAVTCNETSGWFRESGCYVPCSGPACNTGVCCGIKSSDPPDRWDKLQVVFVNADTGAYYKNDEYPDGYYGACPGTRLSNLKISNVSARYGTESQVNLGATPQSFDCWADAFPGNRFEFHIGVDRWDPVDWWVTAQPPTGYTCSSWKYKKDVSYSSWDKSGGSGCAIYVDSNQVGGDAELAISISKAPPTCSISVSPSTSGNAGSTSFTFTANPAGGNGSYTYSWSNPGGSATTGTSSTLTSTYAVSGVKTNTLTVTSNGVSGSCSINVTVKPTCTISVTPTSGTTSTSFVFTGNPAGGGSSYTYSWSNPGGSATTGTSSTLTSTYPTTGDKTASLQVTSNGVTSNACTKTVTVNATALTCGLSVSPPSGNTSASFTYTGTASGGNSIYTYNWSNPDGSVKTRTAGPTSTTTDTLTSTYAAATSGSNNTATLTVTSGTSSTVCTKQATVTATTTAPSCTVTPSSTTGPTGTTFTYTGTASGGNGSYAYNWAGSIDSSSTTNTATGTYNTAGTYTAYLTVTSNGENVVCNASVTVTPPTTYSCQNLSGITTTNATLCPDDTTGLTANTNYSVVDTCTATKCEYKCNTGYHDNGTACEADTVNYLISGKVLNRFNSAQGVSNVNVVVSSELQTKNAWTNSSGNYSTTITMYNSNKRYNVSTNNSTSNPSGYTKPALTSSIEATKDSLSYNNQLWGFSDCMSTGSCNFVMYPNPKTDCQLKESSSTSYTDGVNIADANGKSFDFINALSNPLNNYYSNTLSYGDGSSNFSNSITVAIPSHTYTSSGPFTAVLSTGLSFKDANNTWYRATPATDSCVIGLLPDYTVSGYIKNENNLSLASIAVEVNDQTTTTNASGYYQITIPGGANYDVKIVNNQPISDECAEDDVVEIGTNYYMQPAITTNNNHEYLNQIQNSGDCKNACNFTYYLSPYAELNPKSPTTPTGITSVLYTLSKTATGYAPLAELSGDKICHTNSGGGSLTCYPSPISPYTLDYIVSDFYNTYYQVSRTEAGYTFNYCDGTIANIDTVPVSSAWWQVGSGNVFSNYTPGSGGTTAIKSEVPATESFFSGGGTATWNMGEINVSENIGSDAVALDSGAYGGKTYDYRYWESKLADYTIDMLLTGNTLDLNDISITDPQTEGIYRVTPQPEGLLYISATAAIDSKQIVILHDGNVNITSDITTVSGSDAIIILIASGSITFNNNAGPGLNNYIHGIYIGDTINTGNYANKLSIKGSLIGWTGVYLQRSYASASEPAELFIQNVEMINALKNTIGPLKAFKTYRYTWEEVAP